MLIKEVTANEFYKNYYQRLHGDYKKTFDNDKDELLKKYAHTPIVFIWEEEGHIKAEW